MIWVKVLSKQETEREDFVEMGNADGKKICVIKYAGKFSAIQNTCPHAGGILSGGWCKEGNIVCPIHRWEYNLETGRGAEGQGDYINIYPTKLKEDGLYVGFKESLWKRLFG
ncbi:Rieske (2Fe-2S) protein [Pedobacter sp. UC225_61]|uniref:Rieske (2Fe-2S) protein n=1 Tax=Pedobacter sp. UC225_61 TaxID=3374623 RepID=UPI0037ACAB84